MKKLFILFTIVAMLTACQPAPPSTPTPALNKEVPATLQQQLYGIWYISDHNAFYEYYEGPNGQGMMNVYIGLGNLVDTPTFSFIDGKLIAEKSSLCDDAPATYEMILILENNSVVAMRPNLIGEDPCSMRMTGFGGQTLERIAP